MTLEHLNMRKNELDVQIAQTTNQVFVLSGARQEIDYQLRLLAEKIANEEADKLANSDQPLLQ